MSSLIEKFTKSHFDVCVLRLCVIVIFALFGTYKWFDFEVHALQPLMENTWLHILTQLFGVYGASYFLGVVENITVVALLIAFWKPRVGIVGDILVIVTGLTTLSLLPQLGKVDGFIVKDILLVGAGLVLLKFDLQRSCATEG